MSALQSERVELWPAGAPQAKGNEAWDRPWMSVHRPEAKQANGAAVIVCPGGGYNVLVINHEGLQPAHWLTEMGVTAFVLTYRLKTKGYAPEIALLDGQRAMRWVRAHARDYGINPQHIGMMGFSAGGHLAIAVATHAQAGTASAADPVDRVSARPDFLLLGYAASEVAIKREPGVGETGAVSRETPPAFIFHTTRDEMVSVDPMLAFYQALRNAGVDAELHVYGGNGPHGLGLADGDPAIGTWPTLAAAWMRKSGFLTAAVRAAVSGTVTINGAPMAQGWITFLPVGSASAPPAAVLIAQHQKGVYQIDAAHGPVPGPYRIEVRELCRASPLEPSLAAPVRYTKERPGAAADLACEIKPGSNTVNIAISD